MACAIFVEFALTPLTPIIRLTINFQVSPGWPFAPRSSSTLTQLQAAAVVFLLHQFFGRREGREVKEVISVVGAVGGNREGVGALGVSVNI